MWNRWLYIWRLWEPIHRNYANFLFSSSFLRGLNKANVLCRNISMNILWGVLRRPYVKILSEGYLWMVIQSLRSILRYYYIFFGKLKEICFATSTLFPNPCLNIRFVGKVSLVENNIGWVLAEHWMCFGCTLAVHWLNIGSILKHWQYSVNIVCQYFINVDQYGRAILTKIGIKCSAYVAWELSTLAKYCQYLAKGSWELATLAKFCQYLASVDNIGGQYWSTLSWNIRPMLFENWQHWLNNGSAK